MLKDTKILQYENQGRDLRFGRNVTAVIILLMVISFILAIFYLANLDTQEVVEVTDAPPVTITQRKPTATATAKSKEPDSYVPVAKYPKSKKADVIYSDKLKNPTGQEEKTPLPPGTLAY